LPLVDGKPVDDFPLQIKLPRTAKLPEPEIVPTVSKTATEEFDIQTISASDIFSEQVVMSIEGKRDKLVGSDDSDVFMVNDRGDRVIAGQNGASDSLMTENFSLDLRHKKWDGIENAMLVGSENWNLTGDTESNILSGNGSNNILRGGAGVDTLFGGGGEDIFVISEEIGTIDQIIDFESGEDKIALTGRVFRSLFDKKRQLKDGVIGEKLKMDEVGVLWFDADGTGKKAAFKIAAIGVQDSLDPADFIYTSY
jgi:Ca2+-binding RTX toxin-like protein